MYGGTGSKIWRRDRVRGSGVRKLDAVRAHQRHRTPSLRRVCLRMVDASAAGHGVSRGVVCQASAHVAPDRGNGFALDRPLVLDGIFADLRQNLSGLIGAGDELQFIE